MINSLHPVEGASSHNTQHVKTVYINCKTVQVFRTLMQGVLYLNMTTFLQLLSLIILTLYALWKPGWMDANIADHGLVSRATKCTALTGTGVEVMSLFM